MNKKFYAYAVAVSDRSGWTRFFYKRGKGGRVLTAWCLAGARLYVKEADAQAVAASINGRDQSKGARVMVVTVEWGQ